MTLTEARTLRRGDKLIVTEDTMGCDKNDVERIHPAGTIATVDAVEQMGNGQGWAVHVTIGDDERAIANTFDENDAGGIYPFERA
jgi:hypothetical protein